jgi:hypothetical protein
VRLVQEAIINAVLTEEMFQFQLPAANTISDPISQPQDFSPFVLVHTAILVCEQDDGFEDSSRASFPCWEGGGRGEKTAFQLYAGRLSKKVLQEIGDPLKRRLTLWGRV